MLDIDRGVDVDAGGQQLLHILPAFFMAGARRVGVGQFVHQGDLGLSFQHRIEIQFEERHPLVVKAQLGHDLQPFQQGVGFGPAMGFHIGRHHVPPFPLALAGRLSME